VTKPPLQHETGSENVFADLGLPDADALFAKARLAQQIAVLAGARHLTQAQSARVLGTTQPKVSALMSGKLAGFSIERLIRYLNALGQDVDIRVMPKPPRNERATVRVTEVSAVRSSTQPVRR
jgi:predicted XRE-type DNA-binding protein